ncbi:MAG: neutral/alkaline non-lysosomal ceramidase N-terminal domain-containing protein, partial [Phycisphaerales bacterium]
MRKSSVLSPILRISTIVALTFACVLVMAPAAPASENAGRLRAGTAKVDITPQEPVRMSGYAGRKGLSQGVHDPLSARVVAFSNSDKRLVQVSTDLIGFYDGTTEHIRKILLEEFKLEPSELFLSGIHTHAGPTLTIDKEKGNPSNLAYTQDLTARLTEAIRKALSDMEPVQIGTGVGHSPVGSNRRKLEFDKLGNSQIRLGRNPYGITDKEVLVMKVAKPDGKVTAAMFDYAMHATCLGSKNYTISGDVLGLAEQFAEKILGPDTIAPAFAGASGNINPWFRALTGFNTESGWIPEPVLLGTMLGEEVVHVLRGIEDVSGAAEISTAFVTLELPGKQLGELTIAKDCPATKLNITVARIGDIGFVGIGCEVLTEIGISIKAASPYKHTFIVTHCNGEADYLAPEHLYVEAGYEIRSSPFAPQAAETVVKQAVRMLHG